jgi:K+-transporting ATPase ATPase A chain
MVAWIELAAFIVVLVVLTPLLGGYMAAVFSGQRTFAHPVLAPLETAVYRGCRIDPSREMRPTAYLMAVVIFSAVSAAALFLLLLVQQSLPLNPQHFANVSPLLALNVAIRFATTTNWQAYSGESTLSYLAQMAGLAWQNFVAAAAGLAVAIAVIRGLTRSAATTIGNFWVDLTRSLLYVLLPIRSARCCSFG